MLIKIVTNFKKVIYLIAKIDIFISEFYKTYICTMILYVGMANKNIEGITQIILSLK